MSSPLERLIRSALDHPSARKLWKGTIGRRVRRSTLFRRALVARKRRSADRAERQSPGALDAIDTVCVLIGHTKSGGSLLGAMLDAHPSVIFGDEIDVVGLCLADFSPVQIFRSLERSARREASRGRVTARRLGGYSLAIPGWQGSHDRPRVAGVSRSGPTTRVLGSSEATLNRVLATFDEYRLANVQVVRRPHDSVAAMVLRSGRDPMNAIEDYEAQCHRLEHLRARFGDILTVHYEELVNDPAPTLEAVIEFLSVDVIPEHVEACAAMVDAGRVPESELIEWPPGANESIASVIDRFDFLTRYRV